MKKKITLLLMMLLFASVYSQTKILFIGDSVTDGGWGNSGGTMAPSEERNQTDYNHIYGHSYMMLCASELQASYPERHYAMFNRGISGDDVSRLTNRWQKDAINLNPDLLSLLEGTNDVHYFLDSINANSIPLDKALFDFTSWENSYRALLNQSRDTNPNLKLVLCSPFVANAGWVGERNDFALRAAIIDEMTIRIEKIANEYDAVFVDFNQLFDQLTQQPEGASYWIWDGIHPTPAGHRKMADLWLKLTNLY